MKKLRVLFPKVEAGLGHIMTCKAVEEIFRKKYGQYFEIVCEDFYKDNPYSSLRRYGRTLSSQVEIYTKHPKIGHVVTGVSDAVGTELSLGFSLRFPLPWQVRDGVKYLTSLKPDVIFSTHWATNYYAERMPKEIKPFTIVYCPDAFLNRPFKGKADLTLCSMETGFEEAKNDEKFDSSNFKLVPFCIRNAAFEQKGTKKELRKKIGIDDRFTVVFTEGGYGNGNMNKIIKILLEKNLPMNLIAICGKSEKQFKKISKFSSTENTKLITLGFVKNIFDYISAADLFCGKAGNMIAEPTFFGVPSIISGLSTGIENHIADYYANFVGCAKIETNYKKAADLIVHFSNNSNELAKMADAAKKHHSHFGAEATADLLYEEIKTRFNLK